MLIAFVISTAMLAAVQGCGQGRNVDRRRDLSSRMLRYGGGIWTLFDTGPHTQLHMRNINFSGLYHQKKYSTYVLFYASRRFGRTDGYLVLLRVVYATVHCAWIGE
jgi:hypothetical protein